MAKGTQSFLKNKESQEVTEEERYQTGCVSPGSQKGTSDFVSLDDLQFQCAVWWLTAVAGDRCVLKATPCLQNEF